MLSSLFNFIKVVGLAGLAACRAEPFLCLAPLIYHPAASLTSMFMFVKCLTRPLDGQATCWNWPADGPAGSSLFVFMHFKRAKS